jgi:GNAT superfamily N-acetyltransferase
MLTAQVESWNPFIEEVQPLLPKHWEELALNRDKVPLDPQYHVYDQRDQAGQVMVVTLREAGVIKGYFIGFVAPGLHYQSCLTLTMDIFWTHPDIRGGTAGLRLFKAVEREAKRRGVQRIFHGSKLHKDSGRLFEAMGYAPVETYYSKWIGD